MKTVFLRLYCLFTGRESSATQPWRIPTCWKQIRLIVVCPPNQKELKDRLVRIVPGIVNSLGGKIATNEDQVDCYLHIQLAPGKKPLGSAQGQIRVFLFDSKKRKPKLFGQMRLPYLETELIKQGLPDRLLEEYLPKFIQNWVRDPAKILYLAGMDDGPDDGLVVHLWRDRER